MNARAVRALVCCALVLAGVVAGSAPAVAADSAAADRSVGVFEKEDAIETNGSIQDDEASIEGYDEVRVEIALDGQNGTATWTVQYRYQLDSENATADWDELRTDVNERPDAYIATFENRWAETIEQARNETDRDMELQNFEVEAQNQSNVQEYGFVTFTFQWTSFAHVELNVIEAGDALAGFVLDDRTQLTVTWPEAYNATTIEPTPDDRRENTAIWDGEETEFVEGEPQIELIERNDERQQAEDRDRLVPLPWLAGLGVAVVAIVGVAGWWVMRDEDDPIESEGATASQPPPDESQRPPPELLSNEERVMRLLEQSGGRIKQQEVVSQLGWTEAKTSQVVGDLREDGQVDVFRIGRENVLTLPDEEGGENATESEE